MSSNQFNKCLGDETADPPPCPAKQRPLQPASLRSWLPAARPAAGSCWGKAATHRAADKAGAAPLGRGEENIVWDCCPALRVKARPNGELA